MVPVLAPAPTHQENLAALCARALAIRHREPEAAAALAERAVAAVDAAASADDARSADASGATDSVETRETGDSTKSSTTHQPGDALRRRVLATLGACLGVIPAELARAREILLDVRARCGAVGDDALHCEVLNELAGVDVTLYELDGAEKFALAAVELARAVPSRAEETRALRSLGTALTYRGDYVAALTTLLQALEVHEALVPASAAELDDTQRWERGELFGRIAVVYSNMDQFQQALRYYGVALESFGDRFPAATARTLYRMGIAAEEMEDWDTVERYYGGALEAYQRLGDEAGAGLGWLGMTKLLLHRGAVDDAEAAARQALAALSADPAYVGFHGDAVWVMGDVHLQQGRPDAALASYHEARALFDRTNRPPAHQAHLHWRFSRAYAASGRWEEALREHQRFHELRVRHLEEQANTRMAAMMVQFDTERAVQDREIHRLRSIELEREIAERKEAEAALARAQAELEERNRELHALSIRDPLTGAFNRRYLDQRLAEAMPLAARGIQPLSVMMCDLDDFKRVNDTFSHAVGDGVLRTVAGILAQHLRQSDVVARFGGEEFVVLFPATTLEQARAAGEKICALVRAFDWSALQPGLAVTLSAGVAQAGAQPTPETLLADADGKLYEAKRRGKDCVVS
ncbi:MAG TPA: tetratricopeptide repeat-containing diguanylate cyclase [Longimicrobium sp.]|nr:tetratricopeptide repeat-containing diguanylate cyclase [Longimicrobium sp.]